MNSYHGVELLNRLIDLRELISFRNTSHNNKRKLESELATPIKMDTKKEKGRMLVWFLSALGIFYVFFFGLIVSGVVSALMTTVISLFFLYFATLHRKTPKFLKYFLLFCFVFTTINTIRGIGFNIISFIMIAISGAITYFAGKKVITIVNEKIRMHTEKVMPYINQYDTDYRQAQRSINNLLQGNWYPTDNVYYSIGTIDFFIHALKNKKATTIYDLVNLLDRKFYEDQMLEEQRRATRVAQANMFINMANAINMNAHMKNINNELKIQTSQRERALRTMQEW